MLHSHHHGQAKGTSKEPPVLASEKFMGAFVAGDMGTVASMMDPAIVMTSPMGLFHGRTHARGWIAFDCAVIKKHGAKITVHETRMEGDATKTASTVWSVGALTFTDTMTLNQVLLVRTIRRTLRRKTAKNEKELALTNALLLSWTGPHFEKYCTPQAKHIDNRAMVLPVLDFSFCGIVRPREMLHKKPRDGKVIADKSVVVHYLPDHGKKPDPKEGQDASKTAANTAAATDFGRKEEITIRAKNRDGDQGAIVIDKKMLDSDLASGKSGVGSLEDGEVAVNEDRVRYAASGLRLCNNAIENAKELDQVIRLSLFNAFYFLTWVDLSSNKLVAVPDLSQYPVTTLYLHDNKIKDWAELKKLADLPQLHSLTLFGNELQEIAPSSRDYKFRALTAVKGPSRSAKDMALKTFDHSVLSPSERTNVDRFSVTHSAGRSRPASRGM